MRSAPTSFPRSCSADLNSLWAWKEKIILLRSPAIMVTLPPASTTGTTAGAEICTVSTSPAMRAAIEELDWMYTSSTSSPSVWKAEEAAAIHTGAMPPMGDTYATLSLAGFSAATAQAAAHQISSTNATSATSRRHFVLCIIQAAFYRGVHARRPSFRRSSHRARLVPLD